MYVSNNMIVSLYFNKYHSQIFMVFTLYFDLGTYDCSFKQFYNKVVSNCVRVFLKILHVPT